MKELSIEQKAKRYDEAIVDFNNIQDYEGLYKINRKGEVLSVRSGKLLKERFTWKPTLQQMKALEFYIDNDTVDKDGVYGSVIVKLYEQLKSLK